MKVNIVKMQREHIEKVKNIEEICLREPRSFNTIEDECNNGDYYLIVAQRGRDILGYAGMQCIASEGNINNIAVLPEFRKMEIGRQLMDNLIGYATQNKFVCINLEVRESNNIALNLYKKLGFNQCGLRRDFYKNPHEGAVLMTKYLKEEEKSC